MKFTNKDAKIRFYGGGQHEGEAYIGTTIAATDITIAPSPAWDVDEWAGAYIQFVTGALDGYIYQIASNTADTLTMNTDVGAAGAVTGDGVEVGGTHLFTTTNVTQGATTSVISRQAYGDTWVDDEWIGYKITITSGAAIGRSYVITDNDGYTATVQGLLESAGVLPTDEFSLGGLPYYFELCLDNGDFSGPISIKKHEEILVLDRGNVDTCAHYINDNDAGIMEPLNISFSAMINDSDKFLSFMDMIEGSTVNGHTMDTTKGHHDRIINGAPDLSFFDSTKKTFDVAYKMTGTSNSITYVFNECYFELSEQTYTEAEDGINLAMTGMCYGTIIRQAAFPSGINVLG